MKKNIFEIEYYGKKINIYISDKEDFIQKSICKSKTFYEMEMLETVFKIIPPKGIILDIGANIGNHTLFFSSICGLETYAFEPSSKIRKILEKNIEINNLAKKVHVMPFALGNKNKKAKLFFPNSSNMGMARIMEKSDGIAEDVIVKRLDDFEINDVVLMKIDVEDMELDVLTGSIETIRKNRPIIFAELRTADDYNAVKLFLYNEDYTPVERYNATPTIMFWPKEKSMEFLPSFFSKKVFESGKRDFLREFFRLK